MSEYETLDSILGKEIEAYAYDGNELALRFTDCTVIEWWGYHCYPTNPQTDGTIETVLERLDGQWVESDD